MVNIPSDGINVVNKHKLIRSSGSIDPIFFLNHEKKNYNYLIEFLILHFWIPVYKNDVINFKNATKYSNPLSVEFKNIIPPFLIFGRVVFFGG
jgi:hypothetical protein